MMDWEDWVAPTVEWLIIIGLAALIVWGCVSALTHRDKTYCIQDAKMLKADYKFSRDVCYIKQGDKYYPEDMLKHVTVGDEDFES